MKKLVFRLILLAVVLGAAYGGYRLFQQMPQRQQDVATARVRRGDVVVRSFARGELRAVRSVTLTAPNLFGTIQVTNLAPIGSLAREKDLIVEFDDAEVLSRLEEKQLEIEQVDEQIKKSKADLAIRNNQDQVELLRAKYSVRRSELEVKKNELISQIDARKNQLNLEEAKRRLLQLESDIKSRQEQAQAELAVLTERKNKALLELSREKQRLNQVKLLTPMSGLVAVRQNRTGMFFFGQQIPDIREGDQLQPGTPVADVLDLSEMEVTAKVGELDRANLREGQDVNLRLDAIPEKVFTGKIKSMSGTATANIFSGDPGKKFDVIFSIDMKQLLTALNAKPEQIQKILLQAEQNRRKGPVSMPPPGGMVGGGPNTMVAAAPPPPGGAGAPAGGAPAAGADASPRRVTMQLSPNGNAGNRPPAQGQTAAATPAGARTPGALPPGGPGKPAAAPGPMGTGTPFSAGELAKAKLPPAPEEDSQLEALLRPGLLVDVEIIVDKIPNAINIPMQAVFEKDNKPMVYVKTGSRFEERLIKPLKRSESTMVIAEGLKPGELVAMADPTAKKKDKRDKGSANNPMGGMPGGSKGGM